MKHSILVITATFWFADLAFSQAETSNTDVETAFRIYKERVSEGAAPTLILKNGEAQVTELMAPSGEKTALRGDLTTRPTITTAAITGGELARPTPSTAGLEIRALRDEVDALKKLTAALEKELANCKSNP